MSINILVVDDDVRIGELLSEMLKEEGYEVEVVHRGREAVERAGSADYNLLLLDLQLPDISGIEVLERVAVTKPELPVVMMSGVGTIGDAVKAIQLGAYDFLEKPLDPDRVLVASKNALEKDRLTREVTALRSEAGSRYEMVGDSPALHQLQELIDRIAPTNSSVLILGENGVGKELVARAIHARSKRSGSAFVVVNCPAIPRELIESELFGYEKGAFTGATAAKKGKLEMADGGTLFMDEVGDLSPAAQAKLLRFLQEGELERVGGRDATRVDVRMVAVTNKDLLVETKQGAFRDDLYYRLEQIAIRVPALRERAEDIPVLCQHFLETLRGEEGLPARLLEASAMEFLKQQEWPGNIRELKNLVRRIAILAPSPNVSAKDIADLMSVTRQPVEEGEPSSLKEAREKFERDYIANAIAAESGNMSRVAKVLGMDRSTLYRMLERLGIQTR